MRGVVALQTKTNNAKSAGGYSSFKRCLDVLFSLMFIIALSPVMAIVAIVAAIDTKGSPIFVQDRMGRFDTPFKIYKFRTMSVLAPANVATHKLENPEKYISRVGELLRRMSLDELPQLFNVLKGDMSFVGPRPVVLSERDLLRLRHRNGASRVRPGITGLAQISGRDTVTVYEKARLDSKYAKTYSLKEDMSILVKTAMQVIHSEGIVEGANAEITAQPTKTRHTA